MNTKMSKTAAIKEARAQHGPLVKFGWGRWVFTYKFKGEYLRSFAKSFRRAQQYRAQSIADTALCLLGVDPWVAAVVYLRTGSVESLVDAMLDKTT